MSISIGGVFAWRPVNHLQVRLVSNNRRSSFPNSFFMTMRHLGCRRSSPVPRRISSSSGGWTRRNHTELCAYSPLRAREEKGPPDMGMCQPWGAPGDCRCAGHRVWQQRRGPRRRRQGVGRRGGGRGTTGIRRFAECQGHSAKPKKPSAKGLPSVDTRQTTLGEF